MPSPSAHALHYLPSSQRQRLLLRLIRQPGGRQLQRLVARVHPADVAELFPLLRPDEALRLIEALFEHRLAGPTLSELDEESQRQILAALPDARLAVILGRLPADDAVDLVDRLEPVRRRQILGALDPSLAARLENLRRYGEATAGGLMNPDVIFFRAEQSVGDTLAVLRELSSGHRPFDLFVTDDRGHLIGMVDLWQLLGAEGDRRLREVMRPEVLRVRADAPQEEVARVFSRYDLLMVPVVDDDGRLVGAITVDDVLDVIEEEASADLYRLGSLPGQESLGTPIGRTLRLRLPALLLGLAAALAAAWVISRFEATVARYALLAAFMPIVAAAGGQAGTQTLTVMVGSLAGGEMDLRRAGQVVRRQLLIGLCAGLATGGVLAAVAWLWERSWILAGILWLAQTANFVFAALLASSLPLLLRRLRLDPALGSSTLVTAGADIGGFALFLALASRWL